MKSKKKILVIIAVIIMICVIPGALALDQYGTWNTPDGRFRDDNVAMGIDHSKPNPYLAYNLEKKLYAEKATQLGLSQAEIVKESARFALPPADQPAMRSKGYNKQLVFLVDFPDYPHGAAQTVADANSKLNGPGDPAMWPTDNLHDFYARSSYNQLDLHSEVYGWYRAKHNREYYNSSSNSNNWYLLAEVLTAYDSQIYYPNYDNDKDGDIDNVFLYWTGPDTTWGTYWWAYQNAFGHTAYTQSWDGVYLGSFAWEWYTNPWTQSGLFDSRTPCHEMGHVLGLPDYYDYNSSYGPQGGVGGFDMMDGNWLDHNGFSKYMLDWETPIVIGSNPHDTSGGLYPAGDHQSQTSVLIMPGATLNSYSEFFLAENRAPGHGNDPDTYFYYFPGQGWKIMPWDEKGLTIWHVDYTLDPATNNFKYDNSWTSHKLLRLMEADGKEDIENFRGWSPEDIYGPDQFFGPTTSPNSYRYAGTDTQVHIQDINTMLGDSIWARYMIGEYPPTVTSITPNTGTQNTLLSIYDLEGSNFWLYPTPKVYFWYGIKVGQIYQWRKEYATNVNVESRNKITCTFDLTGIPVGPYAIYVENPDGESGTLTNGLTVNPPWIRVTVPNGGEQWKAGTSHDITWTQTGLSGGNVRIDLWKEWPVGVHQRVITASVPATDGIYQWNIPADVAPSPLYWVNISSLSYPSIYDYTDGWLEITAVPVPALSLKKSISLNNVTWVDDTIDVTAGSKVYYNLTVKNTGNCVLMSVAINDDGAFASYSRLVPGATWKLYYSKTAGLVSHTNTATAGGTSAYGNTPTITDSATYRIKSNVVPLPGFNVPPTDPDGDGIYEDLNANGRKDFSDVTLYFNQIQWITAHEPVSAFDINRNGRIDFNDIVRLFGEI